MLKGTILAISLSVFVASLVLIATSTTGILKENIITGNIIGQGTVISYSFVALALSFIIGLFVILSLRKNYN